MTARSYGQFCAAAKALDLVGERWTVLLVRELLLGPRRFTDLQQALPGIGVSLLSARLRHLEEIGAVRRDRLPPPAASAVYALTDRGMGLAPVVKALADWGASLLDTPAAGENFRPEWLALHCAASTPPEALAGTRETYEVRIGDDIVHLRIADGRARARVGPSPYPADLTLTTDAATFTEITLGRTDLAGAVRAGEAHIAGGEAASDPAVLDRASRVLQPPAPPYSPRPAAPSHTNSHTKERGTN